MMEGRNAETKKTEENVQPVSPIHQYSRERLLELKKVPAARSKPLGLSKEFYTSDGVWDPEKWFKAFIASPEGSPLTISDGRERRRPLEIDREFIFRRRLSDPKERLRDDCIVLSPQRRSFGTGCHVTLSGIGRQVSCPPDFKESAQRERTRRIGSGRIQLEKDYNCRYDNRDDRFERNDSGRGDNFRNNYDRRDMNPRRINTPNRRRNIRRHEDDPAPEWFTDGPNSKTDTIELRGFENSGEQADDDMDEVNMPVVHRKASLSHIHEEDIANISVSERNGSLETNESSSPEDSPPSDNVHGTPPQTSPFFDLDEFFKINIPILGMMDGGLEETDVTQGSRFSRWFSQTANHDNNSRRSSIVEETGCIRDLIETHSSTTISSSSTSPTIMGVSSMHPSQDPHIQHRNHHQLQQQQQRQQPQIPPSQHHPSPYHHKPLSHQQPSLPPVTQLQQMHSLQPSSLPPALHQLSQPIQQPEDTDNSLFSLGPHPVNSSTLSPSLPSRAPPLPHSEQQQQQTLGPSILSGIAPSQGSIVSGKRDLLESFNQDTITTTITTANNINNHHHHHHHHHHNQHHNQHHHSSSSNNNSVLESLFNLNCPVPEKPDPGSPTNVNVHDASAQLKALLFGKAGRDSVAASPTPGINAYGMPGRVKTVAEIEADLHHQMSPNGMVTVSPLEVPDCSGDMSAFNKLLSMMKAAAVDNSKPHIPDRRSPPNLPAQPPPTIPYLTSGQNEFLHALNRNKEQQLQIQQQTLNQIRMQQQHQHHQHHQEQQQQKSNPPIPQQQPAPVLQPPPYVSGVTPTGSGQQTSSDAILNFIKQNPDIIAKPASPNPQLAAVLQHVGHRNLSPGGHPLHPTTSQYLQQNLLSGQPGSVHTSQPRIPSPIMFSQQPPVHLSAPAPVHPGPLVQSSLGQPISNLTSATNIRPHSVLPRVNSPKDMMSFKKDIEEQERFLRKQQERSKSPVSISRGIPTPVNMGPKTSVSVAFTPTSVIRKMHSEKAVEKERQAKQDGCSLNSYSAQKALMKNQMYIDSVLKDSYSNNVCSDSSRSSPLSIICDKKDIGQGPSVNGHPLPRGQDGLPSQQHSGQTPFLPQSHPNLPIDSSIIGGSLNISGSCSSSATPSPSSAKSSKLTPHKGPMSTAGCGEILAAQLFNHEQQNPSPSQTLSSSPCDQSKSLRALMGQGMMQNLTSQLLQSGISNTATSAAQQQLSSSLAGRPIVKGSTSTTSCLRPTTGVQSLTSMNSTKGERPFNYPSSSTTNMELAKVLDLHRLQQQQQQQHQQQQQQQHQQHPSQQPTSPLISNAAHGISQSLSVNSSPPFGIPVSNRMPLPRPLPNIGVHPAANVLQMQFMLHGRMAAMHAQRSAALETRFPGSMRAVYPGVVAPLVQRTSLATTSSIGMTPNPAAAGVVNVGMGQAVSSQIPSSLHKQVSGSGSQKSTPPSLGNMANASGADVLKWFDSDSLRTQLPNMPLPPQGQKVFTVDELERNQQAV